MSHLSPQEAVRSGGPEPAGPCHVCAFFDNAEDEYRALLPFAAQCKHRGERGLHFVDPERARERRERLVAAGIPVSDAPAAGHTELRNWDEVYLRDGRFDQEAMLALVEEAMQTGRPFGRTRLWANMEWTLRGLPGCEDLVEYESRLNPVLESHDDVVVCAYDHAQYSASVVMDILRAHPLVIVGGEIQPNPLYVPTDEFLQDLRQRRAARPGLRSGPA